jgi:hypothetical protein
MEETARDRVRGQDLEVAAEHARGKSCQGLAKIAPARGVGTCFDGVRTHLQHEMSGRLVKGDLHRDVIWRRGDRIEQEQAHDLAQDIGVRHDDTPVRRTHHDGTVRADLTQLAGKPGAQCVQIHWFRRPDVLRSERRSKLGQLLGHGRLIRNCPADAFQCALAHLVPIPGQQMGPYADAVQAGAQVVSERREQARGEASELAQGARGRNGGITVHCARIGRFGSHGREDSSRRAEQATQTDHRAGSAKALRPGSGALGVAGAAQPRLQAADVLVVGNDDAELAHEDFLGRLGQPPFQGIAILARNLGDRLLAGGQQVGLGAGLGLLRCQICCVGAPPSRRTSSASSCAAAASADAVLRARKPMACVPPRTLHASSLRRVSSAE